MSLLARRYDTGELVRLEFDGGRIAQITPSQEESNAPWVAPGFVDLQVNGYGGKELTSSNVTADDIVAVTQGMLQCGVTSYCPTITTQSHQMLAHSMRTIAQACEQASQAAACVCGIHLEGPFLSRDDGPRGAHPLEHIRPPDAEELKRLQEAAGGRIKLLTLSPEYDNAPSVIAEAVKTGMVVAIGHTSATHDQITAAVDAGASMSTHLGNGAHGQIRRHPNYIWSQLAEDRLTVSLICDGHHLPPEVAKVFLRAKTLDRCILVSDITGLGGMPAGRYETSLGAVEVLDDGRLVIAGQRQLLAGAALPIGVGVANVMRFAQLDLAAAVNMGALRPAAIMGMTDHQLKVGVPADLVVFDLPGAEDGAQVGELSVKTTIKRGEAQ